MLRHPVTSFWAWGSFSPDMSYLNHHHLQQCHPIQCTMVFHMHDFFMLHNAVYFDDTSLHMYTLKTLLQ